MREGFRLLTKLLHYLDICLIQLCVNTLVNQSERLLPVLNIAGREAAQQMVDKLGWTE